MAHGREEARKQGSETESWRSEITRGKCDEARQALEKKVYGSFDFKEPDKALKRPPRQGNEDPF